MRVTPWESGSLNLGVRVDRSKGGAEIETQISVVIWNQMLEYDYCNLFSMAVIY